ncbi:MAG: hypothetical protein AB1796_11680 [Bacillota bacterium]
MRKEKAQPTANNRKRLSHKQHLRKIFDWVTGVDFPVKYEGRRPGDPPVLVADSQKIRTKLGWFPSSGDLERIVYSAWRWEQKRPRR